MGPTAERACNSAGRGHFKKWPRRTNGLVFSRRQDRKGQQMVDPAVIEERIAHLIQTSNPKVEEEKDDGATGHGPYPAERAFQKASDGTLDDKEQAAHDAFQFVSSHQMPWLLRFRSVLTEMTSHLPHDMTHCPAVVLIIASSSELADGVSPTDRLAELAHKKRLPKEFQNGLYDPEGLRRQFLVLHDEVDGPAQFEERSVLREMNQRFGPGSCSVLRINSISPTEALQNRHEEDVIWDAFLPALNHMASHLELERNSQKIRGCCLSEKDKLSIRKFLAHVYFYFIII